MTAPSEDRNLLLRVEIRGEADVFALRHNGRAAAGVLGLDSSDQVRIATALSEVGRVLVAQGEVVTAVFRTATIEGEEALEVELMVRGELPALAAGARQPGSEGLSGAAKLVDSLRVDRSAGRTSVFLAKRLPGVTREAGWQGAARAQLKSLRPTTPSDELWRQNQDLLAALEESQRSRDAQRRMNAELEETNRGVMALYSELTEELEHTNQGVVALYAELDDRSQQLRLANEAKSRFLRHVNHELRAPVTSILGMGRLMAEAAEPPLTAEQRHQLELIRGSAADLLTLVNGLLDLAKAESGGWQPDWTEVDLRALLAQLRGTLRPLSTRPDVALVIPDPELPPELISDGQMITLVLRNLLTNGLKFTLEGSVRLELDADETHVRLAVTDTGIGIPPEHRERVFEEFHQVPGPLQTNAGGTGLGLPLVRSLVGMLGGTLTLESELDTGTTVSVLLPRRPPPPENAPALPAPPVVRADPLRIFLVDDDDASRHLMRSLLEEVGRGDLEPADNGRVGEIIDVPDARQTTALMLRLRPHLVFLDLRMPEISGDEVLAAIQEDPRLRATPVVVVTAEPEGPEVNGLAGPLDVLSKADLDVAQVAAVVRAVSGSENGTQR